MIKFETLRSVAAAIPDADIDTDVIFPARFLLLLDKTGLGQYLFNERRFDKAGAPNPDFVLNRAPYDKAQIVVAGPSFGSGSSREHAVWALADFGVRSVIAPSFGEIFYSNCCKNGVLPIRVDGEVHANIMAAARAGEVLTIDLIQQRAEWPAGAVTFEIEPSRRAALLEGLDEIGQILAEDANDIAAFEARQNEQAPWLQIGDRSKRLLESKRTKT